MSTPPEPRETTKPEPRGHSEQGHCAGEQLLPYERGGWLNHQAGGRRYPVRRMVNLSPLGGTGVASPFPFHGEGGLSVEKVKHGGRSHGE